MKFETVIFDLDGTLLDTLSDLTDSVNHMLSAHGYPLRKKEEIRRFLGKGARNLITQSLPEGMDEETITARWEEYMAWYSNHSDIKTKPYDGILQLLDELQRRGVKVAVASNKSDGQVKNLVKRYFPQISLAIGERPGVRRKPAPDILEDTMRLLKANPETTAFMGDSEVDGQTANNAGLAYLAACWGFRDKEELEEYSPVLLMDHPMDLIDHWED